MDPAALTEPDGQATGSVLAELHEWPSGQGVHAVALPTENSPGAQATGALAELAHEKPGGHAWHPVFGSVASTRP